MRVETGDIPRVSNDGTLVRQVLDEQGYLVIVAAGIPLMISTDGSLDNPIEAAESSYPRVDSRIILGEGIFNALVALEEVDMPPLDILKTATLNVARGYEVDKYIGSIEVGKSADLLVLDEDPLSAARHYRSIRTIIKEGMTVDRTALPTDSVVTSQRPTNSNN